MSANVAYIVAEVVAAQKAEARVAYNVLEIVRGYPTQELSALTVPFDEDWLTNLGST